MSSSARCNYDAGPSGNPPNHTQITILQQMISSSSGAVMTSLLMTPMDVVKIRLQQQMRPVVAGECFLYSNGLMEHLCTACATPAQKMPCEWYQRPGHFSGTVDAFLKIARNEGVRSLWSGLSPTLVMAIPATVFYFSVYDRLLVRFKCRYSKHSEWVAPMAAGAIARTIAVTVVSPLEMIRTKMQSEKMSFQDVGKAVRISRDAYGWRGFYLGWGPTIMRDIPFSAIYWGSYELLKTRLLQYLNRKETSFLPSFVCGATAGTFAAVVTAPFDYVKTHRQIVLGKALCKGEKVTQDGTMKIIKELATTRGISALWAGVIPRIGKIAPACAIMIGSYEYCKAYFAKQNRGINETI